MRPQFDDRDKAILLERETLFNKVKGPRVGDYIIMPEGDLRRFTHDWGTDIQTTSKGMGGSWYLGGGSASFSGALDPGISKDKFTDTGKTLKGGFWFFHHNRSEAHNGVDFEIECRVFQASMEGYIPKIQVLDKNKFHYVYFTYDEALEHLEEIGMHEAYERYSEEDVIKLMERGNRHDVTVYFENGDTIRTPINGTRAKVEEYYKIGREFNIGQSEEDAMVKVKLLAFNFKSNY
ncbi:MAG: hypothetical protein V4721_00580 [Bacteroidota bacterium]